MTPEELAFGSIGAAVDLLSRGELTSEELVRLHLERAGSIAGLNAFITLFGETALDEARRADAAAGKGPLHGIPVTAKDIVWSKGRRTTSGSKVAAGFVPGRDAPVLARLREAGAVLLGKTNLHEFAYGVSNVNPHYGPARNPWNPSRISGGSSGGSAVALASGVGYGSIGTDTGGSIRIPSALCGIVGLKPTYGAISREGVTPLSWSLDHVGPMARSVSDVGLLFEVMTGRKSPGEPRSFRGLKIGLHRKYFFDGITAEASAAVEGALARMTAEGAEVVEIDVPEIEIQGACRNVITFCEASSYHEENIRSRPEDYGEDTRELLRLGLLVPATDYLAALRARRRIVSAFLRAFESFDVLWRRRRRPPRPRLAPPTSRTAKSSASGSSGSRAPSTRRDFPRSPSRAE